MPKKAIIDGLQHIQKTWDNGDADFPYEPIPVCVQVIFNRSKISKFDQVLSGRLLLEYMIPPHILSTHTARTIDSIENLNFDLRSKDESRAAFYKVYLRQIIKGSGFSDRDWEIIKLYHVLGMKDAEVADKLRLSRQHVNKTRKKLERELRKKYGEQ